MMYSDTDILERVDEYSLFCHYLKFEPLLGRKYSSPLRPDDDDPSFGIFERKNSYKLPNDFMWKDQAHPSKQHGDIFDLIQLMYGLQSRARAYWKVCSDFNITAEGCVNTEAFVHREPEPAIPIEIKILSRPFTDSDKKYWMQYGITTEILNRYHVTSLQLYWLSTTGDRPYYPSGLRFAYRIGTKYQLYFPKLHKRKKFRTSWVYTSVPGFKQLSYDSPTLIITKSLKDVMCLRALGYEAISPRAEGILLPQECINYVRKRYTRIVVFFDNDGKHRAKEYPFERVELPVNCGHKDISDYYAAHGREQSLLMLKTLLNEGIGE